MDNLVYLDHNATTPVDKRVVKVMLPYFGKEYGNPSSIYKLANESDTAKEEAREKVAKLLHANSNEIVFTGCGTESDNYAVKGAAFANRKKGNHIITSSIEHHAVLNSCKWLEKQGFKVTYLGVDKYGMVNLDELRDAITDKTILISIMHANNEVGTIEPVKEIAAISRQNGVLFHTDAVQTVGKLPLDVNDLSVDLLSLSGHKFYGPKGIGALYIRKGVRIDSLLHGGHHESNRRAGTENVPGIVGLGKAAEIAAKEFVEEEIKVRKLRDRLENGLIKKIDDVFINGHPDKRLPGTLNICIKYIEGEGMLLHLDHNGIAVSSGSACTSASLQASHVLISMGLSHEVAHGSLRFSLGRDNTEQDVDKVIEVLPPIVEKLREMSPIKKR